MHPRHAYAGELVFAAFSGSHQDAINKCMAIDDKQRRDDPEAHWQVAYFPIDPRDLGRSYQQVIRINSQSGKGGVAYVLEQDYGIQMPRWMQVDFSPHVQARAENTESEVSANVIFDIFNDTYLSNSSTMNSYTLSRSGEVDQLSAEVKSTAGVIEINGRGKGVLDAFVQGLAEKIGSNIVLIDYSEHTLGSDEQAEAMAYVQLSVKGSRFCAAARSDDIVNASLQAVLNAVGRSGASINDATAVELASA